MFHPVYCLGNLFGFTAFLAFVARTLIYGCLDNSTVLYVTKLYLLYIYICYLFIKHSRASNRYNKRSYDLVLLFHSDHIFILVFLHQARVLFSSCNFHLHWCGGHVYTDIGLYMFFLRNVFAMTICISLVTSGSLYLVLAPASVSNL